MRISLQTCLHYVILTLFRIFARYLACAHASNTSCLTHYFDSCRYTLHQWASKEVSRHSARAAFKISKSQADLMHLRWCCRPQTKATLVHVSLRFPTSQTLPLERWVTLLFIVCQWPPLMWCRGLTQSAGCMVALPVKIMWAQSESTFL